MTYTPIDASLRSGILLVRAEIFVEYTPQKLIEGEPQQLGAERPVFCGERERHGGIFPEGTGAMVLESLDASQKEAI